jgi:hypothetical protein
MKCDNYLIIITDLDNNEIIYKLNTNKRINIEIRKPKR